MIMQEQDKTIDSITGTVAVLTEQAGLMGQEIEEHMECVFTFDSFHVSPLLFCVSPFPTYCAPYTYHVLHFLPVHILTFEDTDVHCLPPIPSDRMLDDLEANVDSTGSKLQKNLKRLKQFVRETEG